MNKISTALQQLHRGLKQKDAPDPRPLLVELGNEGMSAVDLIVQVESWRVSIHDETFANNALELLDLLHAQLPAAAKQPLRLDGGAKQTRRI